MQSPVKAWSPTVGGHTGTGGRKYASKQSASGRLYQSTKATPSKHQFFQPDNRDRWHLRELTNKGNCDAGGNSMRVCLIISPSTLQKPFVKLLQRRLLRPVSQFLLRLLMKSTKPSHNSDPVVHQGSVASLLNCWRLVALVAPSGWQMSLARLGTSVRPTTSETGNSAITDKPRDAFRGQSRSPNMVPFHMLIWFTVSVL